MAQTALQTNLAQASASLGTLGGTLDAKALKKGASALVNKVQATTSAVEGAVSTAESAFSTAKDILSPLAPELSNIQKRIDSFEDTCTALSGVLDIIAEAHPFVKVAVLAFKAAVKLGVDTYQNEKKVVVLKIQMMDMMSTLRILQNVVKPTRSQEMDAIQDRLRDRMDRVAGDIRDCSNACDGFEKRKLVVRVIKSGAWKSKLADFGDIFTRHTTDIQADLTMYTGVSLSVATEKITRMDATVQITSERIDMLLLFDQLRSTKERDLVEFIKTNGGPDKCINNEALFKQLVDMGERKAPVGKGSSVGLAEQAQLMSTIRTELKTDLDTILEKNLRVFELKFEAQQLKLETVVQREGDRVIGAFSSGPHDRILDPDVHELWKDMKWRGSVKTRTFVLALRDYYIEQAQGLTAKPIPHQTSTDASDNPDSQPEDDQSRAIEVSSPNSVPLPQMTRFSKAEQWSLQYMGVLRIQPLMEAFDADDSGFISVMEVNEFTSSRPPKWSVPQWIAFCAAGYQMLLLIHADRITEALQKMHRSLDSVHPSNRVLLDRYLSSAALNNVDRLLAGINKGSEDYNYNDFNDDKLVDTVASYEEFETERLLTGLINFRYNIDAANTLELITGSSRIELWLTGLVTLLLERHLEIIVAAETTVLARQEMTFAAESFQMLWEAVSKRLADLKAVFRSQNLEVEKQMQRFSHGVFSYWEKSFDAINRDYYLIHPEFQTLLGDEEDANEEIAANDDEQQASDEELGQQAEQPDDEGPEEPVNDEVPEPVENGDVTGDTDGLVNDENPNADHEEADEDDPPLLYFGPGRDDLDYDGYAKAPESGLPEGHGVEGAWHGLYHYASGIGPGGLMSFTFNSGPDVGDLVGSGEDALGSFTVEGKYYPCPDEKVQVNWMKTYDTFGVDRDGKRLAWRYEGTMLEDAIRGFWGKGLESANSFTETLFSRENSNGTFELYRRPIEYLLFGPSDAEVEANKPKALWKFALNAVLHSVRVKLLSWSLLSERREQRERFIELSIVNDTMMTAWGPDLQHAWLDDSESKEFQYLEDRLLPEDVRFYRSIAERCMRRTAVHTAICDFCKGLLVGTRYLCLTCSQGEILHTVDLCPDCMSNDVPARGHLARHPLLQLRTYLFYRLSIPIRKNAAQALLAMKALFPPQAPPGAVLVSPSSVTVPESTSTVPPSTINDAESTVIAPSSTVPEVQDKGDASIPTAGPEGSSVPRCVRCQKSAEGTIWVCAVCKPSTFLCNACNAEDEDTSPWLFELSQTKHVDGEAHRWSHPLARLVLGQPVEEKKVVGLEARVVELESRCAFQERTIAELSLLAGTRAEVEARLGRLEDLLGKLLQRLTTPA